VFHYSGHPDWTPAFAGWMLFFEFWRGGATMFAAPQRVSSLIQSTRRVAQDRACGRALAGPRPLFLIVDCRKFPRLLADLLAPAEQVAGDLLPTCYAGLERRHQVTDIAWQARNSAHVAPLQKMPYLL
jgi:hypothetical protein